MPMTHGGGAASVLFLLSSLRIGGSETKTVRLANALAQSDMRVTLAYLGPPHSLRDEVGPRIELIDLQRRGRFSLGALNALVATVRARQVSTVVSVNLYAALYAALARLRMRKLRPRLLASLNTTEVGSWKLAAQMHLYRRVLRTADLVIFGAEAQRRLWRDKYGLGSDARRSKVIYNGVDTERFAPATELTSNPGERPASGFVIGTVGGLRPEKSQIDIVAATAILRARGFDVRAVLVGEGPERRRIEARIARVGLVNHVTLVGETRDVRPFVRSMDVFVLSSTSVETFSNAALEALSCGVPVIGADVGGMRELLSHGGGVTYPPGDIHSLVDHLSRLLRDAEQRRKLATEARRAAIEHFSWMRMVQEFTRILTPQPADELGRSSARQSPALASDSTPERRHDLCDDSARSAT